MAPPKIRPDNQPYFFRKGDRCLVQGLQGAREYNGSIVEILQLPVDDRYKAQIVSVPNKGKILGLKQHNLTQCELKWQSVNTRSLVDEGAKCMTHMGSVGQSKTHLYVFGGLSERGRASDLWSYEFATRTWRCHWWLGLPSPEEGQYGPRFGEQHVPWDCDLSRSPPDPSGGGLLVYTTASGKDVILYYSVEADNSARQDLGEPPFDPQHEEVDCLWIFRPSVGLSESQDLGYWAKVLTTGDRPSTFLEDGQLEHRVSRDIRRNAVLVPDEDGVRMITWGGVYWSSVTNEESEQFAEADIVKRLRATKSMNGMFELFIPQAYLDDTKPDAKPSANAPKPRWSLLPQSGEEMPMVRQEHTLTLVGRDLILIGGENVSGITCQCYEDAGTPRQLGNYAYNLDTNEWRKLEFMTERTRREPNVHECISTHLAFALPPSELEPKERKMNQKRLVTAVLCCQSQGLFKVRRPEHDFWRSVQSYLEPSTGGRVLTVRQYDDIYRHAEGDDEPDNMVQVYDLFHKEIIPLSTFSRIQSGREDDESLKGLPLWGLGTGWFNAAIYEDQSSSSSNQSLRLLLHGKLKRMTSHKRWDYDLSSEDIGVFETAIH